MLLSSFGNINGIYTSIYENSEIYSVIDTLANFNNNILYNVNIQYGTQTHLFSVINLNNWKTCLFDEEDCQQIDNLSQRQIIGTNRY
jgi:hypothetical protein